VNTHTMTTEELIVEAARSYETYLRAIVTGDLNLQNLARNNCMTAEKEICGVVQQEQAERVIASIECRLADLKNRRELKR
jgi:hypothetical protein